MGSFQHRKPKQDSQKFPLFSLTSPSSSSSSWASISILKPRRRTHFDDFLASLSSLSQSFHATGLLRSALLTAHNSNRVVVYSIWEPDTASDVPDVACKATKTNVKQPKRLLNNLLFRSPIHYPPQFCPPQLDAYEKAISSVAHIIDVSWYEVSCSDCIERKFASDGHRYQNSGSPTLLSTPPSLSLGDTVHIRSIVGQHDDTKDVLDYSCLAILRSFFHQTPGLCSYTFFKSFTAPIMLGLGIWDSFDAASKFLDAPDGAPEECYWKSLGAKMKSSIFRVAFLTCD